MHEYCSGKHQCIICGVIYQCEGVSYGHGPNTEIGNCHGPYKQFCDNHEINEYIEKHKELNEL